MESKINRLITRSMKLTEESDDKPVIGKDGQKRSADHLPEIGNKKRILGDITNQPKISKPNAMVSKKGLKSFGRENSVSSVTNSDVFIKEKNSVKCESSMKDETLNSNDDSEMYMTAFEHSSIDDTHDQENSSKSIEKLIPDDVEDYDASCENDPFSEHTYAADIFKYYTERETLFQKLFPVKRYMNHQKEMTKGMRAILVDWMVEVQESFELNHETLYLAVKLVDQFLAKHFVPKAQLQLIGATAMFIASKFDERNPPLVDDFLYICDDSYSHGELIETEVKMLKAVNFDLGIPLSYRFLRRFGRCGRISMEMLTLARYILETSLMDYDLIDVLDSKKAAGALLLALKMKNQEWTPTFEYYSGYKESELADTVKALNKNLSDPSLQHLQTIRTKYSHEVFFEVAKIPHLKI